ncbi:hypothetical protein [Cellulomonas sp. Marseille-Q8402]
MPDENPRPDPARRRATAWLLLAALAGAALAAVGLWILTRPESGWAAYAPLTDATYRPGRPVGLGAALLAVGAALLGGAAGFRLAWSRRSRR